MTVGVLRVETDGFAVESGSSFWVAIAVVDQIGDGHKVFVIRSWIVADFFDQHTTGFFHMDRGQRRLFESLESLRGQIDRMPAEWQAIFPPFGEPQQVHPVFFALVVSS